MKSILFYLVLFFSGHAYAGGWVSGGGEVVQDAGNPWFLETNHDEITYCVLQDEINFSLSKPQAEETIKKAFDFWKEDFTHAQHYHSREFSPETSSYRQVTCDSGERVDIVFQLGLLVSDAQWRYLGNPKKYVGVAVRTEYNHQTLKGRGFIYISPDKGPLRFSVGDPNEETWSIRNGEKLLAVIAHELGHVFGINHTKFHSLMGKDYVSKLVKTERRRCIDLRSIEKKTQTNTTHILDEEEDGAEEETSTEIPGCNKSSSANDELVRVGGSSLLPFFGRYKLHAKWPSNPRYLEASCAYDSESASLLSTYLNYQVNIDECISTRRITGNKISVFHLSGIPRGTWRHIGDVIPDGYLRASKGESFGIYLPSEQEVFQEHKSSQDSSFTSFGIIGAQEYRGTYIGKNGTSRSVLVDIKDGIRHSMDIFWQGKMYPGWL